MIVLVNHRKSLILDLPKQDSGEESSLFVNKQKLVNLKHLIIHVFYFSLGSVSKGFTKAEIDEITLNEDIYEFSIDYDIIDMENILSIHEHLMERT